MILGLLPERAVSERGVAAPRSGTELRPGNILDDRFIITEVLCQGGMATVFKAQDLRNQNADVALKAPHGDIEMNAKSSSRFQREEEIGARLDHPFILKFVPVKGRKSRPYLVTEYLPGCTLCDLLDSFKLFPEEDGLAIASLICDGLQYLHDRGVIHRDLKPGNIMICFDGSIRIIDFGTARATDSRRLGFLAAAPGTPHYMAPERVKGRRGDPRTDIYGLGVILYQMLTGTIPFDDEDTNKIMAMRVTGDPVAPRKLNPKISPQAEEIILRAMDRNPAKRHPTVAALKLELDAPGRVELTGRCQRLTPSTSWKRAVRKAGWIALWGLVPMAIQVITFLLLWHLYAKK